MEQILKATEIGKIDLSKLPDGEYHVIKKIAGQNHNYFEWLSDGRFASDLIHTVYIPLPEAKEPDGWIWAGQWFSKDHDFANNTHVKFRESTQPVYFHPPLDTRLLDLKPGKYELTVSSDEGNAMSLIEIDPLEQKRVTDEEIDRIYDINYNVVTGMSRFTFRNVVKASFLSRANLVKDSTDKSIASYHRLSDEDIQQFSDKYCGNMHLMPETFSEMKQIVFNCSKLFYSSLFSSNAPKQEVTDGCKNCLNNKPGYESGLFCVNNCVNGSRFSEVNDEQLKSEIKKFIDEHDLFKQTLVKGQIEQHANLILLKWLRSLFSNKVVKDVVDYEQLRKRAIEFAERINSEGWFYSTPDNLQRRSGRYVHGKVQQTASATDLYDSFYKEEYRKLQTGQKDKHWLTFDYGKVIEDIKFKLERIIPKEKDNYDADGLYKHIEDLENYFKSLSIGQQKKGGENGN